MKRLFIFVRFNIIFMQLIYNAMMLLDSNLTGMILLK